MRRGSGQADDPPAAGQEDEPDISSPFASARLVVWHGDLAAWLDRLGWLGTLSDWLTAVLGPVRERHRDNLVVELLHGGRWVGHPLHPALSDLPIGLWAGVMVLDATDRDPAPRRGIDAAGMLSAAGILAAGATALTGLSDWTVSNDQDRRVGRFPGLLSRGPVADLTVTCPLHGSRFALADGCVRRGPASQPQPVLPTRIRNAWIEVRGSQPAPRRPASGRTQP